MDGENVLAKGICERIGAGGHMHGNTADGRKFDFDVEMPNHTVAFQQVKAVLTEGDCAVIASLDEIRAVGHRVVQGGATFNKSMLVDDTVIAGIDRLRDLAPLHNPAHLQGIRACQEVFGPNVPQVVVFDNAFHSTMRRIYMPFPMNITKSIKFAVMASTALLTAMSAPVVQS